MPLMILGDFVFESAGRSYESLNKRIAFEWSKQKRLRADNTLYWAGTDSYTIDLSGTVYPLAKRKNGITGSIERVGINTFQELESMGESGNAWNLIDGLGRNLGRWVIKSIEITEEYFNTDGSPKKQGFNMQLEKDIQDSRRVENTLINTGRIAVVDNQTFIPPNENILRTSEPVSLATEAVITIANEIITGSVLRISQNTGDNT